MGFYDAKGYWRNEGEGFYDGKGLWVNPGGAFYDSKGYLRTPGEGFYDGKGLWVSPGGAFYDGKGYLRSPSAVAGVIVEGENGMVAAAGFLVSIPIVVLWMLAMFLVQWMASHLYLVFTGYSILNVIVCFALTKRKRYCGIKAAVSFIGNYMCFLSFAYIMLGYAVPYVIVNDKSFSSFFEFVVTLLLGTGGIAIVQFFNYYHGKAVLEFVLGILFLGLVLVFLKYGAGNISTVESLTLVYGVKTSRFLVALFGLIG